jgi:transcriptional regulator with GAF, ATPase, and Fis domain
LFEQAGAGTVFLDEVGELPIELQSKLLRVLEDGCVRRLGSEKELRFHGRLVKATNVDVARQAFTAAFRSDLFYRLAVLTIALPPLRERGADVAEIMRVVPTSIMAAHVANGVQVPSLARR